MVRWCVSIALGVCACGPTVAGDSASADGSGDGDASGTSVGSVSTTVATTVSTTGPTSTTATTATTTDPDAGDDDPFPDDWGTIGMGCGDGNPQRGEVCFAPDQVEVGYVDTLAVGDVTGDGVPDVLVIGSLPCPILPDLPHAQIVPGFAAQIDPVAEGAFLMNVTVHPGNGDDTFGEPIESISIADDVARDVIVGDLDGDGNGDLAVAGYSGAVQFFVGDGTGGFAAPVAIPLMLPPEDLSVGDLDGDGTLELAAAFVFDGNDESVALLSAFGPMGAAVDYVNVEVSAYDVVIGDLDIPGAPTDLVVSGYVGTPIRVTVSPGGNGPPIHSQEVWETSDIGLGDLDGDGLADLALASPSEPWTTLLRGNGDGSLLAPETIPNDPAVTSYSIAVGRYAVGGPDDIAIVLDIGVSVHVVETGAWTPLPGPSLRGPLRSTDLNGDEIDDLVALSNETSAFVVLWSDP